MPWSNELLEEKFNCEKCGFSAHKSDLNLVECPLCDKRNLLGAIENEIYG